MHFFLLILEVLFNFTPDAVYKHGEFSKTLLKKDLEFLLGEEINPVLFFLCFMLLPVKFDPISKK